MKTFLRNLPNELWAVLVLSVFGTLLYGGSLFFPFFIFDDPTHIILNLRLAPPNIENLLWIWSNSLMAMTFSWWAAIAAFFGTQNPVPYRIGNLLLHVANAFLLFLFLRAMLTHVTSEPAENGSIRTISLAAFAGSFVFLIHPVHVESVAWISSAKDLLSFFFGMLSLLVYFFGKKRGSIWKFTAATYLLLTAAIFSKASAGVLVIVFFWLDRVLFQRRVRDSLLEHSVAVLGAVAACLVYYQRAPASYIGFIPDLSWRVLIALDSITFYFSKLLLPVSYYFDYGRTPIEFLRQAAMNGLAVSLFSGFAGLLLAAGFAASYFRKHLRPLHLALGLVLIPLLPYLGLMPFVFQNISTVADRYLYLPSIGLCFIIAYGLVHAKERIIRHRLAATLAGFALVVAVLAKTYSQVQVWRDSVTCLAHSVVRNPTSINSRIALSHALASRGMMDEAAQELRTADDLRASIYHHETPSK